MSVEIVPFASEHLLMFKPRDTNADWMTSPEALGPSFTFIEDGRVIGCMGSTTQLPKGVCVAWVILTDELEKHPFVVARTARRMINDALRSGVAHHIEAVIDAESERDQRWIEHLGFKRDRTYIRYVRT